MAHSVDTLLARGAYREALMLCRNALAAAPGDPQLHLLAGVATLRAGDPRGAVPALRRTLMLTPAQPDAASALGVAAEAMGRPEQAAKAYRWFLAQIDAAPIWFNLGNAWRRMNRPAEAAKAYRRALDVMPDDPRALSALVWMKQTLCDWQGIDELKARLLAAFAAAPVRLDPFRMLFLDVAEADLLEGARRWAASFGPPAPRSAPRKRGTGDRLRIGYISADFRRHAVASAFVEVPELHDRAAVDVFGYALCPDDGSPVRARLAAGFDRFADLSATPPGEAARRIANDGIDILVDLGGYMAGARPGILARRPAPVQAQWFGFPGTMGAPFIDYAIADRTTLPDASLGAFSEVAVRLPHCYMPGDRARPQPAEVPARSALALPAEGPVLACFNTGYKASPESFAVWTDILKARPACVLWFLAGPPETEANLKRAAAEAGVAPERLIFAPKVPFETHLARFLVADLLLDTWPYNAHTNAADALWMGCPVVTRRGRTFPGRVAASLLRAAGLDDLIAETTEGYVARVLALIDDAGRRAAIRKRLTEGRGRLPVFDTPGLVRALERGYAEMWRRAVAGEPPAPFDIDPA